MSELSTAHRLLKLVTPLQADVLIPVGLSGSEGISKLFQFQLDCVCEVKKEVPFEKVLGQWVTASLDLPDKKQRHFAGICSRISQGESDLRFTSYRLEIVPQIWLLTRQARSRIFQHQAVPDILKAVFKGFNTDFQLQGTKYEPRDFCVQYRETDFNFACRMMEEEGIYYFFKHEKGKHTMVVANSPGSHADLAPVSSLLLKQEHHVSDEDQACIYDWAKTQEVIPGKYTLWDHCFEVPHKHLESEKKVQDKVQAGQVSHVLSPKDVAHLEMFDWPGEYAQRFDGVDKGGGERPADIQKIFEDNKRTTALRAEEGAAQAVTIQGASNFRHLTPGHKFTLTTLPGDAATKAFKAEGSYVLTSVTHHTYAKVNIASSSSHGFAYENSFTCIPAGLPFRPPRHTPRPTIPGMQTAVVVGPPGEEIFTDKYGRVKVQFHWDREGKNDADSSCWVRVSQVWAGKRWGASFWPRIGQEVVVSFLEGDPDQPIIIGSVYNADQMPPYLGDGPDSKHPIDNKVSGIKSNTTKGGAGFNEWRFDDTKDKEQIFVHAQKDMDQRVLHDRRELVLHDSHLIVGAEKDGKKVGDQREEVLQNKHLKVHKDQEEHIGGNIKLHVGGIDSGPGNVDVLIDGKKTETIGGASDLHVKAKWTQKVDDNYILTAKGRYVLVEDQDHLHIKSSRYVKIDAEDNLDIGSCKNQKVGSEYNTEAGSIHLKAGQTVVIEAGTQLSLKVGGNFIDISSGGIFIQGSVVMINSGGAAGNGPGASPASPNDATPPADAAPANPTKPDLADDAKTGLKSAP